MNNYEHFTAVVAGDDPYSLMEEYEEKKLEKPQIKYYYKDAGVMKAQHLQMAKAFLSNAETDYERLELLDIIETLETQTNEEFWADLSADYELDDDKNILTTENENVKFSSYNLGKNLSLPFTLKNGNTAFQARKGDIDWEKMHLNDYEIYSRTWELVVDDDKPMNDIEEKVKANMKNRNDYFAFFKDKTTYAAHCSAFWGYAFLHENGEWEELTIEKNQIDWVLNYYYTFIEPLSDDTLLTIFECRK
jgi:hypothetical protein